MRLRAATLETLGRVPAGEIVWPRKSASVAPIFAFDGESLSFVFQQLEDFFDVGDASSRIRIENDDANEVDGDVC